MRYPDGTYDLTVDDIHEIRVETSKKLEKMSKEEIIEFFKNESKKFYASMNEKEFALA